MACLGGELVVQGLGSGWEARVMLASPWCLHPPLACPSPTTLPGMAGLKKGGCGTPEPNLSISCRHGM